jgi:hypothetical protein
MRNRPLFLLAASALLLPGGASGQLTSGFQYQRSVVGPGGGMYYSQRSGGTVAGPFGMTSGVSRSGSYVGPGGATVQYAQRSGSVVGPLGGGWAGTTSRVLAESADGGVAYSRYSSSTAVGPVGGLAYGGLAAGRAMAASIGPFGAADYSVSGLAPGPLTSDYQYERSAVGPDGGTFYGQQSGRTVAGPFGMASGMTRSASYVAPSGATAEYDERSGAVVGPLGGGWAGSTSRFHAESADRGLTYSRYSSHGTAFGPVGGVAYGGVAVGPYGAVGYRRSAGIVWP